MQRYCKPVLLVDDNPSDLLLFKRLLEKAGFKVIATTEPDAVMSNIVAGNIGCLITDQLMPISGHELVSLVRGVRSDIGVIFLSGADAPRQPVPPGAIFISKDDNHALLETVTRCMSRFKTA